VPGWLLQQEGWGEEEEHGKNNERRGWWGRRGEIYRGTNMLVPPVIRKVGAEKKGLLVEFSQKNEALTSWGSPYSAK
jgi:hypothetical protein